MVFLNLTQPIAQSYSHLELCSYVIGSRKHGNLCRLYALIDPMGYNDVALERHAPIRLSPEDNIKNC